MLRCMAAGVREADKGIRPLRRRAAMPRLVDGHRERGQRLGLSITAQNIA